MSYRDLKEILDLTISWENKLKDFYDVAEIALRDKRSKKVVAILREKLLKYKKILEEIDLEEYGNTEWLKFPPEYKDKDLIPIRKISRDSSPKEIFERALEYEEKLKEFYSTIHDAIVPRKQKDLFASLVKFKISQIIEITKYMENYDLAI